MRIALLALAACGSTSPTHEGSPEFVQSTSSSSTSGLSFTQPPADGALVIAAFAFFGGTVDEVHDSAGNTYTLANRASTIMGATVEVFYASQVQVADPFTVTVTSAVPTGFLSTALHEYRGPTALSESGEQMSNSKLVTCGTVATGSNAVLFAAMTTDDTLAEPEAQDGARDRESIGFGAPNMLQPLVTEDRVPANGLDTDTFVLSTDMKAPSSSCVDAAFE